MSDNCRHKGFLRGAGDDAVGDPRCHESGLAPARLAGRFFDRVPDAVHGKYILMFGSQFGSVVHYDTMHTARELAGLLVALAKDAAAVSERRLPSGAAAAAKDVRGQGNVEEVLRPGELGAFVEVDRTYVLVARLRKGDGVISGQVSSASGDLGGVTTLFPLTRSITSSRLSHRGTPCSRAIRAQSSRVSMPSKCTTNEPCCGRDVAMRKLPFAVSSTAPGSTRSTWPTTTGRPRSSPARPWRRVIACMLSPSGAPSPVP